MPQSSWQDWKTWPKCVFFLTFFFFPEQQTCQIWVGHALKYGTWFLDEQDTRQNTRVDKVCCSKCFIVSVISFLVYFDKQVHKKLEKKLSKQKNSNLEFCLIKRAPKNKCAWQLWDIGFIFFSLIIPTLAELKSQVTFGFLSSSKSRVLEMVTG